MVDLNSNTNKSLHRQNKSSSFLNANNENNSSFVNLNKNIYNNYKEQSKERLFKNSSNFGNHHPSMPQNYSRLSGLKRSSDKSMTAFNSYSSKA